MDKVKAFFEAIQAGNQAAVTTLLGQEPGLLEARSEQGLSPVLTAAYYMEPSIAAWLVNQGARLDIFEACAVGALERAKELLLENPHLLNDFAPDGFQPLGLAAFFGHKELARLLVERGADLGSPSRNGMQVTPLHSAASGQHLEIVHLLLEAGAPVNAKSAEGFTPLHSAAQNGQLEMVKLLLEHGADPQAATDAGVRPVDLAREKGHDSVVRLVDKTAPV